MRKPTLPSLPPPRAPRPAHTPGVRTHTPAAGPPLWPPSHESAFREPVEAGTVAFRLRTPTVRRRWLSRAAGDRCLPPSPTPAEAAASVPPGGRTALSTGSRAAACNRCRPLPLRAAPPRREGWVLGNGVRPLREAVGEVVCERETPAVRGVHPERALGRGDPRALWRGCWEPRGSAACGSRRGAVGLSRRWVRGAARPHGAWPRPIPGRTLALEEKTAPQSRECVTLCAKGMSSGTPIPPGVMGRRRVKGCASWWGWCAQPRATHVSAGGDASGCSHPSGGHQTPMAWPREEPTEVCAQGPVSIVPVRRSAHRVVRRRRVCAARETPGRVPGPRRVATAPVSGFLGRPRTGAAGATDSRGPRTHRIARCVWPTCGLCRRHRVSPSPTDTTRWESAAVGTTTVGERGEAVCTPARGVLPGRWATDSPARGTVARRVAFRATQGRLGLAGCQWTLLGGTSDWALRGTRPVLLDCVWTPPPCEDAGTPAPDRFAPQPLPARPSSHAPHSRRLHTLRCGVPDARAPHHRTDESHRGGGSVSGDGPRGRRAAKRPAPEPQTGGVSSDGETGHEASQRASSSLAGSMGTVGSGTRGRVAWLPAPPATEAHWCVREALGRPRIATGHPIVPTPTVPLAHAATVPPRCARDCHQHGDARDPAV